MYLSKACVQEAWYIVSGLDIQPEQSKNNNPAYKKWFQVVRYADASIAFFMKINMNSLLSG